MKTLTKTAVLSIAATLTLTSTIASAVDIKTFPGSICKAYHGTDASKVSFPNGTLKANVGMSITCPVPRDVPENGKGVAISLWGTKGAGMVSCTFRDSSYGGGNIKYYSLGTATANGQFFLSAAIVSTQLYGNFSMYCGVPSGAVIKQIRLTEAYN